MLPLDSELAATFVQAAQDIIDTLTPSSKAHARFTRVWRGANGKISVKGEASTGGQFIIEASTNLVDWEKIGVTENDHTGLFEFEDPSSPLTQRFYRVMAP